MTSLFSRLQKLNKEATEGYWGVHGDGEGVEWVVAEDGPVVADHTEPADARFIVECRNSLPAVLNLIEAAEKAETALGRVEALDPDGYDAWKELREAVAVFVSGQEEGT